VCGIFPEKKPKYPANLESRPRYCVTLTATREITFFPNKRPHRIYARRREQYVQTLRTLQLSCESGNVLTLGLKYARIFGFDLVGLRRSKSFKSDYFRRRVTRTRFVPARSGKFRELSKPPTHILSEYMEH
jgi:hypothetical protein